MKRALIQFLSCVNCPDSTLELDEVNSTEDDEIFEGQLKCVKCHQRYPILRGIPRFVPPENYAASFGFQWNKFQKEQLDTQTQANLSEQRLLSETGWPKEWFKDKWILDAGCGAGRFLEIAARLGAQIVGVDLSLSVDGVRQGLPRMPNLHLVQGSIFNLPFKSNIFDACYCIGVLQHTPDPLRATGSLPRVIKPKGKLAVTIYENRRFTRLNGKYWARLITRFMPQRLLLATIQFMMPVIFPLTSFLYRLPVLGKFFRFAIPFANYVELKQLSFSQRYRLAVLDTFDMLAPAFDLPQREADVRMTLSQVGVSEVRRLDNPGLNLVGQKGAHA